jgi:hypothetical protein
MRIIDLQYFMVSGLASALHRRSEAAHSRADAGEKIRPKS